MSTAPATSFESAWAQFQALDSLQLSGEPSAFARGRAQNLAFLVRIEDKAACEHLGRVAEQIARIPGVEPFPSWFFHATVKLAGFQVIRRTHDDDVLRQDVPRIATKVRDVLSHPAAFQLELGLMNSFRSGVFMELRDGGAMRKLNGLLMDSVPELPRYPIDAAGFLPHVSLARFTSNEGLVQLKAALAELRTQGPGPSFTVGRVEFVRVWLSDEPSEFDTLASYQLAPARVTG